MNTLDFYNSLINNNMTILLVGEIELVDDEMIKWTYDGLGDDFDDINEHLYQIYENDLEMMEDHINDENIKKEFNVLKPDIDDTIITFSIVEA